jgi:predicted RNA-binding Zn-ribbon protein involved in translation (DUF1610 family)
MYDPPEDLDIPQCPLCGWELHGTDYSRLTCRKCEDRLYDQLNSVLDLWLQLPSTAYRRTGAPSPGRSMAVHASIPGNGVVLSLTAGGDDTPAGRLVAVEDDWRRARGLAPREQIGRPEAALRESVKFLRAHLPWACGPHLNPPMLDDGSPLLPDVELLAVHLRKSTAELQGAIAQASSSEPRPRTIPVTCGAVFPDGSSCTATVRVGVRPVQYTCPECGAAWQREHFLQRADEIGYFEEAA